MLYPTRIGSFVRPRLRLWEPAAIATRSNTCDRCSTTISPRSDSWRLLPSFAFRRKERLPPPNRQTRSSRKLVQRSVHSDPILLSELTEKYWVRVDRALD